MEQGQGTRTPAKNEANQTAGEQDGKGVRVDKVNNVTEQGKQV